MAAPDLDTVKEYLDGETSHSDTTITSALAAEAAAQARSCRVPGPAEEWPADLVEALCRRVHHNLALRAIPTGQQQTLNALGATTRRVGGLDAEVRRLEAPYRRLVLG